MCAMKVKVPERAVLSQVIQYLRLRGCLVFRMNTGANVFQNTDGRRRFVRFGTPGMADVLAFTTRSVIWVECKSSTGRQSDAQRVFQRQVEEYGHTYVLARSVGDVMRLFEDGTGQMEFGGVSRTGGGR